MKNQKPKRKTKTKYNLFRSILNRIRDRKRKKKVTRHVHPRRLARSIARAKMEAEGLNKINRRSKGEKSLFAREWRNYI